MQTGKCVKWTKIQQKRIEQRKVLNDLKVKIVYHWKRSDITKTS